MDDFIKRSLGRSTLNERLIRIETLQNEMNHKLDTHLASHIALDSRFKISVFAAAVAILVAVLL